MAKIVGELLIARDAAAVFDRVADQRNEQRFNPKMVHAEKLTPGPVGLGTRWSATVQSRGRPVEMLIELTEFDRPRRLASVTTMPGTTITGALMFEPVRAGTMLRWSWDVHPDGALRLLGPVVALVGRREERRIWEGLKTYLEG